MVEIDPNDEEQLAAYFNGETARIAWQELERFFAQGVLLFVDDSLDLIEVAVRLTRDDKVKFEAWIADQLVGQVTDQQASGWQSANADLWAVVAAPFVLVQERAES